MSSFNTNPKLNLGSYFNQLVDRNKSVLFTIFSRIQQAFNVLSGNVDTVTESVSILQNPLSRVVIKRFFVNGTLDVPYPSEPSGTIFLYSFEIDGTGNYAINLPSQFKIFGNTSLSLQDFTQPNSITTFMCYKQDSGDLIGALVGNFAGADGLGTALVGDIIATGNSIGGAGFSVFDIADNDTVANLIGQGGNGGQLQLSAPGISINSLLLAAFAASGGPALEMDGPGGSSLNILIGDGSQLHKFQSSGEAMDMEGLGNISAFTSGKDLGSLTPFRFCNLESGGGVYVDGVQIISDQQAAVADASGGVTIDTEARAAINTLLARLRAHGLIAT